MSTRSGRSGVFYMIINTYNDLGVRVEIVVGLAFAENLVNIDVHSTII
jgi:hypothetical protein